MGRTEAVEALVVGGVESAGRRKGDARATRSLCVLEPAVAGRAIVSMALGLRVLDSCTSVEDAVCRLLVLVGEP